MAEDKSLLQRILDEDARLRAAEQTNPVGRVSKVEAENARLVAQVAAENERLGIKPGAHRKTQQEANAYRRQSAIQKLYEGAWTAFGEEAEEVEVEVTDEYGDTWTETRNPAFEDAVAKLMAFGKEAEPFLARLHEEFPFEVEEAADMAIQLEAANAEIKRRETVKEALAQRERDSAYIEQKVEYILGLNKQFLPYDQELVDDIAHWRSAAKSLESTQEKHAAIDKIKELELEQGRRALAQQTASEVFLTYLNANPADTPKAQVVQAFVDSLKIGDAEYESFKVADGMTRRVQAEADMASISDDSRTASGHLVLISPDGKQTLTVTDDGAGSLLAQNYVPIRQYEAKAAPDYDASLNAGPTRDEQMDDFVERWNARDHDAEAEAAQAAWAAEQNEREARHAEAQAEREARNSNKEVIQAMEARLGRDDGSND